MKERGREKAHELKDEAQHRALDAAKKGKQSLSGHLRHISTALEAAAQRLREQDEGWLADYGQQAADGLERACESMESKEPKELLNEVEDYGRRSPTTFMESAFMGGLLLGRFLKSSARGQDEQTSESWATGEASASEAA
jgi:vacuolar-type H+-ATPase subunit E/Vma4